MSFVVPELMRIDCGGARLYDEDDVLMVTGLVCIVNGRNPVLSGISTHDTRSSTTSAESEIEVVNRHFFADWFAFSACRGKLSHCIANVRLLMLDSARLERVIIMSACNGGSRQ